MAYKLIDRPTQETRLAATSMVQLLVAPSFPPLAHFPCCHNWTICEPRTPLLRQRTGYIVRANETPANGSHRVPSDSTLR